MNRMITSPIVLMLGSICDTTNESSPKVYWLCISPFVKNAGSNLFVQHSSRKRFLNVSFIAYLLHYTKYMHII